MSLSALMCNHFHMPGTDVAYKAERFWVQDSDLSDWTVFAPQGVPVMATGPCPSCGHQTSGEIQPGALGGGAAGERDLADVERVTRVFDCSCKEQHLDTSTPPSAHFSCGRWWLASIRLKADGEGQRIRASSDETLLKAAQALRDQAGTEETRLRASAEKWTAAVTALLGLFGLAGFVVGKDTFTGLPLWVKWSAGLATLAAVALGASAVYLSYKAAYGWPVIIDLGDDEKLLKWYADKRARLGQAANDLKTGVLLAIMALTALALAAGLILFAPREPPKPLVKITLVTDAQVCGHVLTSTQQSTVWIMKTNGDVITIPLSQVRSIAVVATCPA
jgi:hypothetical protein